MESTKTKKLIDLEGIQVDWPPPQTNPDFAREFASQIIDGVLSQAQNHAETSSASTIEPINTFKAIGEFIDDRKLRGCTEQTLHTNYELFLRRFFKEYSTIPSDPKVIRHLLAPFKGNTILTYWRWLSAFYTYLESEHSLPNPMCHVPKPKVSRKLPDHLGSEQKRVLEDTELSTRDMAIIKLFLETAARPGEVAMKHGHPLRFCDIYDDHIEVCGKKGDRFIPITYELKDALLSLQDGRPSDAAVFANKYGNPMTEPRLRKVVRQAFNKAGIDTVRPTPYTLRHSFAGEFLNNGGNIAALQRILGHSKIETTMIYTHISDKSVVESYRKHGPRGNNRQL